jgi:hypothetical protein
MGTRSLALRVPLLVDLALMVEASMACPFEAMLNSVFGTPNSEASTRNQFAYEHVRKIVENAIRH